jgi:hypothetical protein
MCLPWFFMLQLLNSVTAILQAPYEVPMWDLQYHTQILAWHFSVLNPMLQLLTIDESKGANTYCNNISEMLLLRQNISIFSIYT